MDATLVPTSLEYSAGAAYFSMPSCQAEVYADRILNGDKSPLTSSEAADDLRAGGQPQNRPGARSHRPALDPWRWLKIKNPDYSQQEGRAELFDRSSRWPGVGARQAAMAADRRHRPRECRGRCKPACAAFRPRRR